MREEGGQQCKSGECGAALFSFYFGIIIMMI